MTQVARVFVVINLLLAAGFLFSAATFLSLNEDYKQKLEDTREELAATTARLERDKEALRSELDEVRTDNDALKQEIQNIKGERDALAGRVESLESQLKTANTQNSDLRTSLDKLQAAVNRQGDMVDRLNTESKEAAAAARKARDDALQARNELEAERKKTLELRNEIARNEAELNQRAERIDHLELMVQKARDSGVNFENLVQMKPVEGQVVRAENSINLAVLNVGSEEGVSRGYVFSVVRGGEYIGRVVVDNVQKMASSGTITIRAPGKSVRPGDRVTNTLE